MGQKRPDGAIEQESVGLNTKYWISSSIASLRGARVVRRGGILWNGGGATFINKGTNGRWRDELPADESAAYDAKAVAELGVDCAHWLATGEMPKVLRSDVAAIVGYRPSINSISLRARRSSTSGVK